MLIRSKNENTLVDFNGSGVFWHSGAVVCACGGTLVKIKGVRNAQETEAVINKIQEAYLKDERIVVIE